MNIEQILYDFQREDVDYLDEQRSVLIANDMGTGKTLEAIARDLRIRARVNRSTEGATATGQKTLVVAPLTTLSSWEDHFAEYAPLLSVRKIAPKKRELLFRDYNPDVYLVHYEALRLLKDELQGIRWTHIIADECHRIKNRKTQQTQNLKRLETVYKTAMSGTPVVNRPDEMWSVLNWLYPKVYTSYWKFYRRHVEYEVIYPQGFHKIIGPANVEELKAKIAPFYVRRRKDDVLKDLPDKYYTNLYVDLTPQQARAYTEMKKDMLAWIGSMENQPLAAPVVIARLVRLQQFAVAYMEETGTDWDEEEQKATVRYAMSEPSAKLDALMQMLEDNPDEPFVVFSQFKQAINLLKARLKDKDIPACFITGDTHQELRGGIVKRFQEGGPRVLAGTIATGGVGITLTRASRVVFIDRSWSPAYNLQAEDRLHRIGQKNAVQVIDLIARGTVDLGRHQRLDQKWSWIRSILGDT